MKQVEQLDISYSTDENRCSVFAAPGSCLSSTGKRITTCCGRTTSALNWALILELIPTMKILQ